MNGNNKFIDLMKQALDDFDMKTREKAVSVSQNILDRALEEIYRNTKSYAITRRLFIKINTIDSNFDNFDYDFSSTAKVFPNLVEYKPAFPDDSTISNANKYVINILAMAFKESGASTYLFNENCTEKLVVGICLE